MRRRKRRFAAVEPRQAGAVEQVRPAHLAPRQAGCGQRSRRRKGRQSGQACKPFQSPDPNPWTRAGPAAAAPAASPLFRLGKLAPPETLCHACQLLLLGPKIALWLRRGGLKAPKQALVTPQNSCEINCKQQRKSHFLASEEKGCNANSRRPGFNPRHSDASNPRVKQWDLTFH